MAESPDQPPSRGEGETDETGPSPRPERGPEKNHSLDRDSDAPWLIGLVIAGGSKLLDAVHYMAATCCENGRYERAEWFAREGLGAAGEQRDLRMLMRFHVRLGEALLGQGRGDEALGQLTAAYDLADGVPLTVTDARIAASALASAYRKLGDGETAARWSRQAVVIGQRPRE